MLYWSAQARQPCAARQSVCLNGNSKQAKITQVPQQGPVRDDLETHQTSKATTATHHCQYTPCSNRDHNLHETSGPSDATGQHNSSHEHTRHMNTSWPAQKLWPGPGTLLNKCGGNQELVVVRVQTPQTLPKDPFILRRHVLAAVCETSAARLALWYM